MGVEITDQMIGRAAAALVPTGTRPVEQVARDVLSAALSVVDTPDSVSGCPYCGWSSRASVGVTSSDEPEGDDPGQDEREGYRSSVQRVLEVDDEHRALAPVGDADDGLDFDPDELLGSVRSAVDWLGAADCGALNHREAVRLALRELGSWTEDPPASPSSPVGDAEPVAWSVRMPGSSGWPIIVHPDALGEFRRNAPKSTYTPLYEHALPVSSQDAGADDEPKVTPAEQTMMALLGAAEEEIERTRSRYTGVKRALEDRVRVINEAYVYLRNVAYATDEAQATAAREVAELIDPYVSDREAAAGKAGSDPSASETCELGGDVHGDWCEHAAGVTTTEGEQHDQG